MSEVHQYLPYTDSWSDPVHNVCIIPIYKDINIWSSRWSWHYKCPHLIAKDKWGSVCPKSSKYGLNLGCATPNPLFSLTRLGHFKQHLTVLQNCSGSQEPHFPRVWKGTGGKAHFTAKSQGLQALDLRVQTILEQRAILRHVSANLSKSFGISFSWIITLKSHKTMLRWVTYKLPQMLHKNSRTRKCIHKKDIFKIKIEKYFAFLGVIYLFQN